jgi:hypothetical protein
LNANEGSASIDDQALIHLCRAQWPKLTVLSLRRLALIKIKIGSEKDYFGLSGRAGNN